MLRLDQIGKCVEGSQCGLIWGTILAGGSDRQTDRQKKNPQETWKWTAGVQVKIGNKHLLYTNHKDYNFGQFGCYASEKTSVGDYLQNVFSNSTLWL